MALCRTSDSPRVSYCTFNGQQNAAIDFIHDYRIRYFPGSTQALPDRPFRLKEVYCSTGGAHIKGMTDSSDETLGKTQPEQSKSETDDRKLRVLLADDSPQFLLAASEFIKRRPRFEMVGMALNGEDTIRLAQKLEPDLVLVDYVMPEISGPDATRELKKINPAPRVFIMTMHDSPEFQQNASEAGADAFVLKDEFLEKLEPLVDKIFFSAAPIPHAAYSPNLHLRMRELNRGARIVVIDDDKVTQELIKFMLTNVGYKVSLAGCGEDGIRLVREQRPELVILDVGLPDISGLEVCRRLKDDSDLNRTLVMHLSATHTTERDMRVGLEGGADAYFTIPFRKEQLLERVDALVRIARLEDALRANDALQEDLFGDATLGVAHTGASGKIEAANKHLANLLKTDLSSLTGRNFTDFFPPADVARTRATLARLDSGEQPLYRGETRLLLRDDTELWVRLTALPHRDGAGRLLNLLLLVDDISAQKQATVMQKAMIESLPASIAVVDTNGAILATNRAWDELAHATELCESRVAVGTNYLELIDRACATTNNAACLASKGLREVLGASRDRFELDYDIGQNDDRKWYKLIVTPMGQGVIRQALVMHLDCTVEKRMELQLQHSQKLEALGQLAGGVAHDFNNVLMVIRCNAELMTEFEFDQETIQACVGEIRGAADRAEKLTRQLLAFGRRQAMEPHEVDLNGLIRDLARMLERLIGERVRFNCNYCPESPVIFADPGMIEQILMNLAVNARDAMPEGGALSLATTIGEWPAPPDLKSSPGTRFVCLTVGDTGTGIPAEAREHVFEPFFTTKDRDQGTGLGLATVHGIVKQHCGWIKLDSEPGKGTVFRIYLPLLSASQQVESIPKPTAEARKSEISILLIEDEPDVLRGVAMALRRLGHAVLEAPDGATARRLFSEHRESLELIITDQKLPERVSGIDLATGFRRESPNMKILVTSGCLPDEMAGLDDRHFRYLAKPYTFAILAETIRDFLYCE